MEGIDGDRSEQGLAKLAGAEGSGLWMLCESFDPYDGKESGVEQGIGEGIPRKGDGEIEVDGEWKGR